MSVGIERRKSPRKNVLLTGKVIHGEGAYVLDCTIRDVSTTGARITLAKVGQIPQRVFLLDLANRVVYETEVMSERAGGVGLKFVKAREHDGSGEETRPSPANVRI